MGCMPDLSAFNYINDVVIMAPEIFELVLQSAIKDCDKRLSAGKPPASAGICGNMGVKVVQGRSGQM